MILFPPNLRCPGVAMHEYLPFSKGWPLYLEASERALALGQKPDITFKEKLEILETAWKWIGWAACHFPDAELANECFGHWLDVDQELRRIKG